MSDSRLNTIEPVMSMDSIKVHLLGRRQEIRTLHINGASAARISSSLVDLCDQVVRQVYLRAVEATVPDERLYVLESLALVAVGGYGRGDLAPYSDVDLLFLTAPRPSDAVLDLAARLVRDLWDAGLHLSQSVRCPADCASFARTDFAAGTALFEMRLVAGDPELLSDLRARVQPPRGRRRIEQFIDTALAERAHEHRDYFSSTAFVLEPNVKKSPGGLRDIHLLRWLALTRLGTADFRSLQSRGVLSAEDVDVLVSAFEFLRRIRHHLHFRAGCTQDVVTREEQLHLAQWLGFREQGTLLPVECFMQHYYRQTVALQDVLLRFVGRLRRTPLLREVLNRILTQKVAPYVLVRRDRVELAARTPPEVLARADTLIHVFDYARGFGVPVSHETLDRIRAAAASCSITLADRRLLLQCLATPAGLGGFLRYLHRTGLLERLIPSFEHARGLIQFNQLHHYTVDEHSIRAVEAAVRRAGDRDAIGLAYRDVRRKDILHLALLLHDLGKGLGDDHCEVGKQLAEQTADLFGLNEHERRLLVFLVHNHLSMAHTALRRDVSDVRTLIQFARSAATPEVLRMLYVITAADIEAVAPGELTAWKESLLTDLYSRAMEELAGETPVGDETTRSAAMRTRVRQSLTESFEQPWLDQQLESMPLSYLVNTPPQQVRTHLHILHGMGGVGVRVRGEYLRDTQLSQYTVFTHDKLTPGIFSKIAGVLAASGFQIHDAQIVTRADGVVLDTFRGVDQDFAGEPPATRRDELCERIEHVLLGRETVEDLLSRRGQPLARRGAPGSPDPLKVEIDNESSDRCTIIEVFANDRLGLLYSITKTLFDLGLSVYSAKISTHYDQIVDTFYVTGSNGEKVNDATVLCSIRERLLQVI